MPWSVSPKGDPAERVPEGTVEKDLSILSEVMNEMDRQIGKWGVQHHPLGTGGVGTKEAADFARETCDKAAAVGLVTWLDILHEEFREAAAEADPGKLRGELIQVMAVCASIVRDIDANL